MRVIEITRRDFQRDVPPKFYVFTHVALINSRNSFSKIVSHLRFSCRPTIPKKKKIPCESYSFSNSKLLEILQFIRPLIAVQTLESRKLKILIMSDFPNLWNVMISSRLIQSNLLPFASRIDNIFYSTFCLLLCQKEKKKIND